MEFDFQKIFLDQFSLIVALEILMRTVIMFITVLAFLRFSGKKGIRQLSLFEVAIIISLGSAAGDPMFQGEVAIIPALVVFTTILGAYRLITWLMMRSERIETLMEGKPEYVVENGVFVMGSHDKHTFAQDEFFSEMRQQGVEHLGQVKKAILETNGVLSIFFFPKEDVQFGLPICPKEYEDSSTQIPSPGEYACTYCGNVEELEVPNKCSRCEREVWVRALDLQRES
jgi:uncharacterized membrane protein YcaP (DUF421 family)